MKVYVGLPMRIFCFSVFGGDLFLFGTPLFVFLRYQLPKDIYLHSFNLLHFLWVSFFTLMLGIGFIIFKQAIITITVTESGVELSDKLGRDKLFLYEEISEIRKPWFARWGDLFVIVSKSGKKILFSKLMRNSDKLIAIIHGKTGCRLNNFTLKEIRHIRTTKEST